MSSIEKHIAAVLRFCTSRSMTLVLITLSLLAMLVGSLVPQAFLMSPARHEKWHTEHPAIAPIADLLGLDRIYTHPFFIAVLALAVVSLLLSAIDQIKSARRRSRQAGSITGEVRDFPSPLPQTECDRRIRSLGYCGTEGDGVWRYLRHPWGLWGNVLLHAGMLLVIVSSLYIALTQQRGLLHIARGETFLPSHPWSSTETGLLAAPLVLDEAVRLDDLHYEYWPSNGVKVVSSAISFLGLDGSISRSTAEINSILYRDGLRIYQGTDFGHAFFVKVTDMPGGQAAILQLLLNHQTTPDQPSYNEYGDILAPGTILRAKYFVDVEKRSLMRENPQLTLRLDKESQEVGRLSLKPGEEGGIGQYRFRLLKASRWTSLIFVRLTGMAGIFAGFCIIAAGSILNYFIPTREIVARQSADNGLMLISWHPGRFGSFYDDEFERLLSELTGNNAHG